MPEKLDPEIQEKIGNAYIDIRICLEMSSAMSIAARRWPDAVIRLADAAILVNNKATAALMVIEENAVPTPNQKEFLFELEKMFKVIKEQPHD